MLKIILVPSLHRVSGTPARQNPLFPPGDVKKFQNHQMLQILPQGNQTVAIDYFSKSGFFHSSPLPEETVLQCHPEAIAEGSAFRKCEKMRDSSLPLRMTFVHVR